MVLFSEVLPDLTLHFEPDVLAEPEELPAQRGDADIRLLVVGREAQDLIQMVRAEHAGIQGDRPLQFVGVLSTANILGRCGLFEPGLSRDVDNGKPANSTLRPANVDATTRTPAVLTAIRIPIRCSTRTRFDGDDDGQ